MAEVTMPRLSDTMEQGTIAKWLKQEGEVVKKGEPLVEIETDKANMVLDSYDSGVLERIVVREGQTVPIGEAIAVIASERAVGARPSAPGPATPPTQAAPREPVAENPPPPPEASQAAPAGATERAAPSEEGEGTPERIKASPLARRIAEEHEVDLSRVQGSGPGGRITKEDVERHVGAGAPQRVEVSPAPGPARLAPEAPPAARPAQAGEVEIVTPTRMQATIARRMVESKTTTPHFYVTTEVNMDAAVEFRAAVNATLEGESKVGFNELLLRAVALALRKFPDVNASFVDGQLEYHKSINVGLAVAVPRGLVVPVLREVDRKSLVEIARESGELVEKTRANRLAPAEWERGTFTVSNLGMYDVDEFAAIITPPQSGILAVGSIKPAPAVIGDEMRIARLMRMTLSADHRVYYGATGAEFLQELKRLLEKPLSLLL